MIAGVKDFLSVFELLLAVAAGIACAALRDANRARAGSALAPLATFAYTLYLTYNRIIRWLIKASGLRKNRFPKDADYSVFGATLRGLKLYSWLLYLGFERNTDALRRWNEKHGLSRVTQRT